MKNNGYCTDDVKTKLRNAMPKTRSAPMNERIVRLWIHGFNAEEIASVSGSTVSDVEHAIAQHKKNVGQQ
jgi:hypothetical protein